MENRHEPDGLSWEPTPEAEPARVIEIAASVSRLVLEFRAEKGTEASASEHVIAF
jgi:hypothetical protein